MKPKVHGAMQPSRVRNARRDHFEAPAWTIEPWIASPPDTVVYEYGVRLDRASEVAAGRQIDLARDLRQQLVSRIRSIHDEMNEWVLARAGRQARQLHDELTHIELRIRAAKAASNGNELLALVPRRNEVSAQLIGLLRPLRSAHREEMRRLFFARLGRASTTDTYRLRCDAVARGLGWATANHVLDGALLAYARSMAAGHAPRARDPGQRQQDSLHLQFTTKGGLPVAAVTGGASTEIHLQMPPAAARRAYGAFRFRLGAAIEGADAVGTWQCHRELPADAHVVSARLVRRRSADRYRWAVQLVLRLAQPIRQAHDDAGPVAALHFGWTSEDGGRRVATIARSAEPAAAESVMLPPPVEETLQRAASHQSERARSKVQLVDRLLRMTRTKTRLSSAALSELQAIAKMPAAQVPSVRLYELRERLARCGIHRHWLDEWVALDRRRWQAAAGLGRRARGRRLNVYREIALRIAREHRAVVMEPLDLRTAGLMRSPRSGRWGDFSRHARSGKAVAALHELEGAIRWACVRHGTPVFEISGPSASTCACCGALVADGGPYAWARECRCPQCGARFARHANAAACVWRMVQPGMDSRLRGYAHLLGDAANEAGRRKNQRLAAVQAKRRARLTQQEKAR